MSLVVDRYEMGPVGTNCYVIRAERGAAEAVVVDPGGDSTQLRLELARSGARCTAIFVTHADADHVAGLADLAEGTGAPIYAPPRDRMPPERARSSLSCAESPPGSTTTASPPPRSARTT